MISTAKTLAGLALALTVIAVPAGAAVLTDLYSTGVDAAGVALVGGDGTVDPHYTVTSSDISGVVTPVAAQTYYNGAYAAESAASRWISYSGSPFAGVGNVSIATTFDLTGFDASTASISGLWGVDNDGEIFLNGVTTGITLTGSNGSNFTVLHAFSITSGFVSGVNTLSFAVFDSGSPLAVRAELTGNATAVPEPATWGLMIAGFAMTGFAARRRRVRATAA